MAGTIAYLPPEVVRGERSTERSDVYELGATLHALACASVPFRRPTDENPVSALARILNEAPADLVAFGVPPALAQVIGIAMAKEPAARYQSAAALGEALIEVQRSLGRPPTRMVILGDGPDDTITSYRSILPPPTSEFSATTAATALPTTWRQPAAASPAQTELSASGRANGILNSQEINRPFGNTLSNSSSAAAACHVLPSSARTTCIEST